MAKTGGNHFAKTGGTFSDPLHRISELMVLTSVYI